MDYDSIKVQSKLELESKSMVIEGANKIGGQEARLGRGYSAIATGDVGK